MTGNRLLACPMVSFAPNVNAKASQMTSQQIPAEFARENKLSADQIIVLLLVL